MTPGFIFSQKSLRMGISESGVVTQEIIAVLPFLSLWLLPSISLYNARLAEAPAIIFQARGKTKGKEDATLPAGSVLFKQFQTKILPELFHMAHLTVHLPLTEGCHLSSLLP
jgi:hypothetical protein